MDQKNMIIAIALSVAIIFGFQFFYELPRQQEAQQLAQQRAASQESSVPTPQPGGETSPGGVAPAPGSEGAEVTGQSQEEILAADPRLEIRSDKLVGSIRLTGGRIDDLILSNYRQELDENSPPIRLLHPAGGGQGYFADIGWSSADSAITLPNNDTLWQAEGGPLTPDNPVTLTWDNGQGLTFERRYALDEDYMFSVTQRVTNDSGQTVSLAPYGLVSRRGTPEISGFYILHEGLLGVFDSTLKEVDYDDLVEEGRIEQTSTGGWLGITDKYWLVALVPDQSVTYSSRFVHSGGEGAEARYQADYLEPVQEIPAGASAEVTNRIFAGAKVTTLLDDYQDQGVDRFELAVDWGWFYFLTKPIFYALHWFHGIFGNFGISILALTVIIKLIFFPLANKSYKSMAKMRKLAPEMQELRERYGDDKQKLNQGMMELYKKEKVNPLSGCLPILVQIPVFFSLYKVLFVTIEMRHAPFFGWIQDLSAKDPTSVLNLFGLLPYTVPDLGPLAILSIGVWPLIMGCTMWFQQFLNPAPPDKTQAMIFQLMPIFFTFILAGFPAGLVIYWTWNNTLSILQQAVIMKRQGVPIGRNPKKRTS
ncbi:MAG: membrane protein insertase YidC [Limibacillus sp.]|jgi:YidC/Oxa1 family membrane protein insertase